MYSSNMKETQTIQQDALTVLNSIQLMQSLMNLKKIHLYIFW